MLYFCDLTIKFRNVRNIYGQKRDKSTPIHIIDILCLIILIQLNAEHKQPQNKKSSYKLDHSGMKRSILQFVIMIDSITGFHFPIYIPVSKGNQKKCKNFKYKVMRAPCMGQVMKREAQIGHRSGHIDQNCE